MSLSHICLFVTPRTVGLPRPRNFPNKNTGVGCHFLLQGIFLPQALNPCVLHLLPWQVNSLPPHHLGSHCICVVSQSRPIPLFKGFARQEYWSGLPFPSPGDLPDPGIETEFAVSPAFQAESLPTEPSGKPAVCIYQDVNKHIIQRFVRKEWDRRERNPKKEGKATVWNFFVLDECLFSKTRSCWHWDQRVINEVLDWDVTERAGDEDGVSGLLHTYFASFRPVSLIQLQFLLPSNMANSAVTYFTGMLQYMQSGL